MAKKMTAEELSALRSAVASKRYKNGAPPKDEKMVLVRCAEADARLIRAYAKAHSMSSSFALGKAIRKLCKA